MSGNMTSRRSFIMRGAVGAAAVTVSLPLLDLFLDDSGTAYAASLGGAPLPVRFGTWFWGCGMIPDRWEPKNMGAGYDLPPQLAPIKSVQEHVTVLTGFGVDLGDKGNLPHISGNTGVRTGAAADNWLAIEAPTIDVLIGDAIGNGAFFRSLDLSADGDPRTSYSFRDGKSMNASIPTPLELYNRIFGINFRDPNQGEFTPDPQFIVRSSALSGVTEQRQALMARLGAADRARLDQYFTSVREMENKLALQLKKPEPLAACQLPERPTLETTDLTDYEQRAANHKAMAQLLAMALACNQTKVFNMAYSVGTSDLRKAGNTTGYHQSTHEELIDRALGYQPSTDFFATRNMEAWADFVAALAAIKEGDGTLLDNTLVFAHSDVSYAKNHDVGGIPIMLAGRGGGKFKPGIHVNGSGENVTRVGLTLQQSMGVQTENWGIGPMETSQGITEILV